MKRGIKNTIYGLIGQLITICLGVVVPRLVLVSFGSEVNGLLNSITQVYAYFALIEAGIGATTLQALYAPVAKADKDKINGILSATNKYYKKVSCIYFFAVLLFAIFYPLTVKSSLPYLWVFLIITLNGLGSVINFWVQGKYVIFLNAIGKNYININLGTISSILTSTSKIVLLLSGCDVLTLQFVYFTISLLKMIYIYIYIKRSYPWINVNEKPQYEALEQKRYVLVHQISFLIFNNTDILFITYFFGLKYVSVYSMYLMLFSMLNNICNQLNNGFSFRLGQIYNTSKEKYTELHDIFEVYYLTGVFFMYTMAFLFVIPFLRLYTAGISDINYLDIKFAALFYITNLLSNGRNTSIMVINFAGHFKGTVKQTVLESTINVVCSLIFMRLCGVYGVLMGTIAALLYRTIDMIFYSNKILLKRTPLNTIKRWMFNFLVSIIIILICLRCRLEILNYATLFTSAASFAIVIGLIYFILNSVMEYKVFYRVLGLFRKKMRL